MLHETEAWRERKNSAQEPHGGSNPQTPRRGVTEPGIIRHNPVPARRPGFIISEKVELNFHLGGNFLKSFIIIMK